jgi:hypothetical protein
VLPDEAAPCLSFQEAASSRPLWEMFGAESNWSAADRERLARFRMIGTDGAGNPICLEQDTGSVVLLDHEDRFRTRQFVNSSVRQLGECLLAYMGAERPEDFQSAVDGIDRPEAECIGADD